MKIKMIEKIKEIMKCQRCEICLQHSRELEKGLKTLTKSKQEVKNGK